MDYKEKLELTEWHIKFTDLNGTDAKVLFLLISKSNYKTGEISLSFDDISKTIRASKVAVAKSIAKLIKNEAIRITEKNSGKMAATYKISNLERLNFLFKKEESNSDVYAWLKERDRLFFYIEKEESTLNYEMEECEECRSGEYRDDICPEHRMRKNELEDKIEFRKYKLWLMDNPRPESNIVTIKGIEVKPCLKN